MKKKLFILVAVFLPILILDQFSKYIISKRVTLFQKIPVIKHYFNIVHVNNTGVAFGLFYNYSSLILIIFTAIIIVLIAYILFKFKIYSNLFAVSLSLIIAGAFSNLISRVFQGYVVDFLDFHIQGYHWPSFNIADSSVVVGTIILFISIIKYI